MNKINAYKLSSNDCITIVLGNHKMKPLFTYFMFENEVIHGFKKLDIKIVYDKNLHQKIMLKYDIANGNGTTADSTDLSMGNANDNLVKWLLDKLKYHPANERYFNLKSEFIPMGDKVHEYHKNGKKYEYFRCDFSTKNFLSYHNRLQSLLFYFIEGVVEIEPDYRWSIILVYEESDTLVGYCSYYNFFHYPEKTRVRISQFIVFPPFQNQKHGKTLYEFLYAGFKRDEDVVDVTVEDPNDSFQDMRDKCDVRMLMQDPVIKNVKVKELTKSKLLELKLRHKLCLKQFQRAMEILMLKMIKKWDNRALKEYRLWVKQRIFLKNKEVLEGMDFGLRLSKLQETFEAVEEDYNQLLLNI